MDEIKVLCFDVIGTVVDWRGTITSIVDLYATMSGIVIDSGSMARDWAKYYAEGDFKSEDDLRRKGMDLLHVYGLSKSLDEVDRAAISSLWTSLFPWPDARRGLRRLRLKYLVVPLSNCTRSMIGNLSRNTSIEWDRVLSAEDAGAKKPDRRVYEKAASDLGLDPGQIMMVAAHRFDLRGAKAVGFRTAFVDRGEDSLPDEGEVDLVVGDFLELADAMASPPGGLGATSRLEV
jgi:2-haloacid dehalogenase